MIEVAEEHPRRQELFLHSANLEQHNSMTMRHEVAKAHFIAQATTSTTARAVFAVGKFRTPTATATDEGLIIRSSDDTIVLSRDESLTTCRS